MLLGHDLSYMPRNSYGPVKLLAIGPGYFQCVLIGGGRETEERVCPPTVTPGWQCHSFIIFYYYL